MIEEQLSRSRSIDPRGLAAAFETALRAAAAERDDAAPRATADAHAVVDTLLKYKAEARHVSFDRLWMDRSIDRFRLVRAEERRRLVAGTEDMHHGARADVIARHTGHDWIKEMMGGEAKSGASVELGEGMRILARLLEGHYELNIRRARPHRLDPAPSD